MLNVGNMRRWWDLCFFVLLASFYSTAEDNNEIVDFLKTNNLLQGKAEIVFLLDRSGSVGAANFEIEKGFVESLLTHVVVDVNASRVAVISYSNVADRHIDFLRNPKNKCFLSEELQDIQYKDVGATNISGALDEAHEVLKNARPNVNKVVILVSDGLATHGGDPAVSAQKLKNENVQIFSFGIGRFLMDQLRALATSPKHTYGCTKFKEFKKLAKKIRGGNTRMNHHGREYQLPLAVVISVIVRIKGNQMIRDVATLLQNALVLCFLACTRVSVDQDIMV